MLNNVYRIFFFSALVILGVVLAGFSVARAQIAPSLAVHPEKFELSLSRGSVWSEALKITNTGREAMPIHLRAVRWEARDEIGGINFVSEPEDPSFDIIQWMTIGKNDFILEAGETERVPVTITVPQGAEPGGKYGALFIEPTLPEFYFSEGAPRVVPQIGVLFLIDIPLVGLEGALAPQVALEELGVEGRSTALSSAASRIASLFRYPLRAFAADAPVHVDVLSKTASSFVLRVRNDGITHVRPSGTVTVHNLIGSEVARAEIPPTTILPGKVRRFPVELASADRRLIPGFVEEQLGFGRYTATVVLEGIGEEPFLATLAYWIFPWQALLTLFVVAAPFGFFGYRFRGRIKAAFRALFRGRPS